MTRPEWIAGLDNINHHTPASHYGRALNAYADWYSRHIHPGALFSAKYRFAYAMVNQALSLGWIPPETPYDPGRLHLRVSPVRVQATDLMAAKLLFAAVLAFVTLTLLGCIAVGLLHR